jgi:hypothetical protein
LISAKKYLSEEKCHATNYVGLLFSPSLAASLKAEMDYKECRLGCKFAALYMF